jgi:hypothetical protein
MNDDTEQAAFRIFVFTMAAFLFVVGTLGLLDSIH